VALIASAFSTGTSTIASLLPVWYEKSMLERLRANLQLLPLGQKRSIPRNYGKTIVFNRPVKFGAKTTALTEGTNPTGNVASSELVSGTVKQYGDWIAKSDLAEMTVLDHGWLAEEFEYSARLTIDTLIANEYRASASAVTVAEASISSQAVMQAENLRRLYSQLRQQDVPGLFDGGRLYAAFIHPANTYDLMSDTSAGGWHDSMKATSVAAQRDPYITGFIRDLLGFRIYESTNVFTSAKASSTGSQSYADVMAFGKDAYGVVQIQGGGGGNLANPQVIAKPLGSGGTEDPLNLKSTIGWKVIFLPLFLTTTSDNKRGFVRHVPYTVL
jgi:N4-gp56 family major capsid protein